MEICFPVGQYDKLPMFIDGETVSLFDKLTFRIVDVNLNPMGRSRFITLLINLTKTLRQKLPSYGKVDITIYECTCNMLICGGILLKFQQNARFEMRNPKNDEFIFCCVAL